MTNEERRKATEWFRNRAKNCPMSGVKRMYEIATEALEERERNGQPHWIPCSERLPELREEIIATNGWFVWCAERVWYPDTDEVLWEDCSTGWTIDDVLAWMPLPEPYEGEKE